MVGRLIQQHDIRRSDELSGQSYSAALSSAQLRERGGAREQGIESETVEYGIHPRRNRVSPLALESFEIAAVSIEERRRRIGTECGRLIGERLFQPQQFGKRTRGRLPYRLTLAKVAVLLEQRHAQPGLSRYGAVCGALLAGDHLEQSCLSRAVSADDAPALAAGDRERDA